MLAINCVLNCSFQHVTPLSPVQCLYGEKAICSVVISDQRHASSMSNFSPDCP